MNRLIYILALLVMFGCETAQVINNAKPEDISKAVNNISAAAETVTRTWVPWYFLLIGLLVVVTIRVWKKD